MVLHFINVYNKVNRTLHGHLQIRNLSSHVQKYFTRSHNFSGLEEKFCFSARQCNNPLLILLSAHNIVLCDCNTYLTYPNKVLCSLEQSTVFKIVLDDDIRDGIEHKLYIVGVCGTCEVGVYLLCVLSLVKVLKLKLDVGSSFLICV